MKWANVSMASRAPHSRRIPGWRVAPEATRVLVETVSGVFARNGLHKRHALKHERDSGDFSADLGRSTEWVRPVRCRFEASANIHEILLIKSAQSRSLQRASIKRIDPKLSIDEPIRIFQFCVEGRIQRSKDAYTSLSRLIQLQTDPDLPGQRRHTALSEHALRG